MYISHTSLYVSSSVNSLAFTIGRAVFEAAPSILVFYSYHVPTFKTLVFALRSFTAMSSILWVVWNVFQAFYRFHCIYVARKATNRFYNASHTQHWATHKLCCCISKTTPNQRWTTYVSCCFSCCFICCVLLSLKIWMQHFNFTLEKIKTFLLCCVVLLLRTLLFLLCCI